MDLGKPLISVVVPIYNTEKYLPQCLDSIVKQTYENLEIILVNDGSSDNSPDICRRYEAADTRIKVFDRANHGVSAARNFGIEHASGEFLSFVDSDDHCDLTLMEKLVEPFDNDAELDISVCGIKWVPESGQEALNLTAAPGRYSVCEYLEKVLIRLKIHTFCGAPYAKLYRMNVIRDTSVCFDESVSYAEDFMFNMSVLEHAKYISITQDLLYYYRRGLQTSLSYYNDSMMPPQQYWRQRLTVNQSFRDIYRKNSLYEKYKDEIDSELLNYIIESVRYIVCSDAIGRKEKAGLLTEIRSDPWVGQCLRLEYGGNYKNRRILRLFRRRNMTALLIFGKVKSARKNHHG